MSTDFSDKVIHFSERAMEKMEDIKKYIVLELFTSVVLDTPVDTGRARGNWQVSLQLPKTKTIDREDKTGDSVTKEIASTLGNLESVNYLANNLPYIIPLEYGHSKRQAPNGMVRKNMARIVINVNKAVRENKI